jgi:thiamine transporter
MKETRNEVLNLVQIALYAAIFIVLDLISNMIPFLKMPNGGSIGISVIVLLLASYRLGWKGGLTVVGISLLLMFMTGGVYSQNLIDYIYEYIFAFGIYGLAVLVPTFKIKGVSIHWGIYVTNFLRFLIHLSAGVWFWGLNWTGSFVYNAPYMLATTIVCALITPVLLNRLRKN